MRIGHFFNIFKRRRRAEMLKEWAGLIATPEELAGISAPDTSDAFSAPGQGRLGVSHSEGFDQGDVMLIVDGVEYAFVEAAENTVRRGPWAEETESIAVKVGALCPAGTVSVFVFDEWTRPFEVATVVVS